MIEYLNDYDTYPKALRRSMAPFEECFSFRNEYIFEFQALFVIGIRSCYPKTYNMLIQDTLDTQYILF